ncbi:DUF317 domain-containing protein [Streptomyces buecherae]|uniref:DUF317 domain-containing protein n=1 Tax=Streptomyces buecherae TaxID=2763006 RepID=UPI0036C5670C
MFASSPCARLWTRFAPEPECRSKGTWTIGANLVPFGPRTWQITFDATTPAEVLHDVHTELLDLYLEDHYSDHDHLFEDATAPHEAYAPLLTRGWSHTVKTDGTQTFLAPDELGGVRHRYAITDPQDATWRAWGGMPNQPHWQARFSYGAPTTLVAAFTASLISTEPLHRTVQDVPGPTHSALYVATTTAKQPHSPAPATPPPPPPAPVAGRTR